MPVYRFRCTSCDTTFEELYLSFAQADRDDPSCPACRGAAVRTYAGHAFHSPSIGRTGELSEDSEEYREMHYHEKRGEWESAAKAAEGVNEFARKKFVQKAEHDPSGG